jgi:hypothetical protein
MNVEIFRPDALPFKIVRRFQGRRGTLAAGKGFLHQADRPFQAVEN